MGRKKLEDKDKKKKYNIMLSDKEDKLLDKIARELKITRNYTHTRSKTIASLIELYFF